MWGDQASLRVADQLRQQQQQQHKMKERHTQKDNSDDNKANNRRSNLVDDSRSKQDKQANCKKGGTMGGSTKYDKKPSICAQSLHVDAADKPLRSASETMRSASEP